MGLAGEYLHCSKADVENSGLNVRLRPKADIEPLVEYTAKHSTKEDLTWTPIA